MTKKCFNVKDESEPRPDKDLEERARGGGRPGFKLLFISQTIRSANHADFNLGNTLISTQKHLNCAAGRAPQETSDGARY